MAHELPSNNEIPYIPFPENPKTIKVGDFLVHEYVSPIRMRTYVENLSDQVNLRNYEDVLVNMNGGMFLFEWLSLYQAYQRDPVIIEYHRPPKGYGALIKTEVPKEYQNKKVLVIDDIYDTGGVLQAIMKRVSPSSNAVALITKNGISNQIQLNNIIIGLRIDPKWVGGVGMDLGIKGERNTFRNYPGLVVKIEK